MTSKRKLSVTDALHQVPEAKVLSLADGNASEDDEILPERHKLGNYSKTALKMMTKMGYETDKGLGKQNQGRLEPVEAFQQTGRSGLGANIYKLAPGDLHSWDESLDIPEIPEFVSWFTWNTLDSNEKESQDCIHFIPDLKYGLRLTKIDDQNRFCDAQILTEMVKCKNKFDNIDNNVFQLARTRSNLFETIRSSIFQNRAAVKMANIDALLGYMFTNPIDENGASLVLNGENLLFADICAG